MRIAWWKFCSAISTVRPKRSFSSLIVGDGVRHQQRRQPDRGLVDQQQPRRRHQRARDREHLLLAARQRAGELAPALLQHREGLVAEREVLRDRAARRRRNAPSSRFSSTVSFGNSRRPSGTSATPRLTISSVRELRQIVRLCRRARARSRRASAAPCPSTHFISVLLPLPLVPSSATVSPGLDVERHAVQRRAPRRSRRRRRRSRAQAPR